MPVKKIIPTPIDVILESTLIDSVVSFNVNDMLNVDSPTWTKHKGTVYKGTVRGCSIEYGRESMVELDFGNMMIAQLPFRAKLSIHVK
jgi:hypothetical protein